MAQPFDSTRLATTGEAVQLAEGIPTYTTASRIAAFAASPGGLLVHQGGGAGRSRLLWKDRQGKVLETLGEVADEIRGVALSPDGKRVAVHLRTRADTEDLWIFEGGRGVPTRFTFGPKRNREELWSPDGSMIYFTSDRKGTSQDIYRKASTGTGAEELVWSDGANNTANCVSPDGKWLLYTRNASGGNEAGTRRDLMLLPLGTAGKAEPRVFLQTPFNESAAQFSLDGRWIAYVSDDGGGAFSRSVYVAPLSGAGGKRQISVGTNIVDAATMPRWRRDGKEIFYVTRNGNLMAAALSIRNGAVEVGKVEKLFEDIVTTRYLTYDVSADGQRFLVVDDGVTTARPLTLVQNWVASLKK